MNRTILVTAVSLAVLFVAHSASAACPTIYHQGNPAWYQFNVDSSCLSSSGATGGTLSCGWGGYLFGSGFSNYTSWSFTVPADGTPTANSSTYYLRSTWSASIWLDFSSPTQSAWDTLNATVTVTHNGSNTVYPLVYLSGATASTQSCARHDVYFSATNGDTITVNISTSKWGSGSSIGVTEPSIVNN